jgi:isocitrate dehydrogenase
LADAIIGNLGVPVHSDEAESYACPGARTNLKSDKHRMIQTPRVDGEVAGIDLFVESSQQPGDVATAITAVLPPHLALTLISNRGTQVWPTGSMFTDCVNQYRVRIEIRGGEQSRECDMHKVALAVSERIRVCSTEILMRYGGNPAYSLAQGQ